MLSSNAAAPSDSVSKLSSTTEPMSLSIWRKFHIRDQKNCSVALDVGMRRAAFQPNRRMVIITFNITLTFFLAFFFLEKTLCANSLICAQYASGMYLRGAFTTVYCAVCMQLLQQPHSSSLNSADHVSTLASSSPQTRYDRVIGRWESCKLPTSSKQCRCVRCSELSDQFVVLNCCFR